jgi:signal transduction histidine kinase
LYGTENVINEELRFFSKTKIRIDTCMDHTRPSLAIEIESIKRAFLDAKSRGVRLRYLTEITNANISYCKELVSLLNEVRHLDGIKGNFMISETEYLAPATSRQETEPTSLIIYSSVKEIVEHQQYVFETLWNKAMAAEDRIRQIEEGVALEFIETLSDYGKIQELGYELVKSAKQEILIIFSTSKAFFRQQKSGLIELVNEAAVSDGVKVRILVPLNDVIKETIGKLREEAKERTRKIEIRNIQRPLQTWISILVVDRMLSLAVELRDDTQDTSHDAIGLATYSNSKSTVLSYASIFESLWMQSELYEELESANEQLKVHDKIQREFINIAAHELRTPIQPILSLSEIVLSKANENDRRELIDIVVRNARRLRQITENILDVTKIESQSLILNKESCDLNEIVTSVIQDYKNQIDKLKLKLQYKTSGNTDNTYIFADKSRLYQVISNLLNNAVSFTKNSGGDIIITTERNDDIDQVRFGIKDSGEGIAPEVLPKLFSKFSTKSPTGTGLGLFISKSIIEAHGGRIWGANNADGKGATFGFSLPIRKSSDR